MKEDINAHSTLYLDQQFEYVKKMGAYKPSFEGIPEDYYPLSTQEVLKYTIFVVSIISGTLGIMIGLLFWVTGSGLNTYIVVWSIFFLVFAVVMMILFFIGGKGRIK